MSLRRILMESLLCSSITLVSPKLSNYKLPLPLQLPPNRPTLAYSTNFAFSTNLCTPSRLSPSGKWILSPFCVCDVVCNFLQLFSNFYVGFVQFFWNRLCVRVRGKDSLKYLCQSFMGFMLFVQHINGIPSFLFFSFFVFFF